MEEGACGDEVEGNAWGEEEEAVGSSGVGEHKDEWAVPLVYFGCNHSSLSPSPPADYHIGSFALNGPENDYNLPKSTIL